MAGIDKLTLDVSVTAMDALWLRQQLIAQNVASAKVDGYTAQRLNFEAVMEEMAARLEAPADSGSATAAVSEAIQSLEILDEGLPVQVDREMADSAVNGIRYQALLTSLGKLAELSRLAVSGGAR